MLYCRPWPTSSGASPAPPPHHWKRSLPILAVVLVAIAGLAAAGGDFSDEFSTPGTETQPAYDLLAERFPAQSGDTANVVFSVEDGTLRDRARAAAIDATVARSPDSRR